MIHLHNINKKKIAGLVDYKDLYIESELQSGDKTLCFSYPKKASYHSEIVEECYITTKENEYIVKEKNIGNEYTTFKCILNLEDLEGSPFERYASEEQTIDKALALALAGTGWIVGKCSLNKKRTVRLSNCSSLEVIKEIKKIYRVDLVFNTLSRTIDVYEHLGEDKGTYFIDSLNLEELNIQCNSYEFFTRLIPVGKDDLKITSINNGKEYVENHQYSNKIKTIYWKDDRYSIVENLKEDAEAKLRELSKPYRSYSAKIINLAKLNNKYKNILDYKLGDTIYLISKENKFKDKQRIVKIIEYPGNHELDSVELSNTILSFEEIQTQFQEAADTVNNITTDNGTVDGSKVDSITTNQISDFEANVVKVTDLTAVNAKINNLEANNIVVSGQLTAIQAKIGTLTANVATIDSLTVTNSAYIADLQASKASITQLEAVNANIKVLESNVGKIETLVNGNLSSENIQAGGITSDKLTIANGFITNAMIDNLDVSKINAGDISTNKFRITSDSGNMLIADNTIQIRDKSRVRVQIGKDASNDYNLYLWDANGNLMFDATGLKANGIKDKIIRDDMISDNANIDGNKLNINSVVSSINNGSTTIKGSKVQIDGTNQTLDVSFNSLKTEVQGIQVGARNLTRNSNFIKGDLSLWGNNSGAVFTTSGGYSCARIFDTTYGIYQSITDSTPKIYSISFLAKVVSDKGKIKIGFLNEGVQTVFDLTTSWKRYTFTTPVPIQSNKYYHFYRVSGNILITEIKVEEGTKSTGWTLAPEDVDGELKGIKEITTSQSTTISVMQGQISTAINNTQIIKDGQTILLKDDYNRTVSTVDSMKSTIGSHTTQISQHTGQITGVETRVNTVERSLDGITARVSSTETKIDNLSIGGRNHIYNSDLKAGSKYFVINASERPGSIEFVEFGGRKCIKFTNIGYWNVSKYLRTNSFWFPEGEYLTFSMDVYLTGGSKFAIDTSGILDRYDFTVEVKELNKWLRVSGTTFDRSKTSGDVGISIYAAAGTTISGYITLLKAETGNKSTDWSSAPEDTESRIDANASEIVTTKSKVSNLEINLDSITSRVSKTEVKTGSLLQAMDGGKVLFEDPTFLWGSNSTKVYNNAGNGLVTVTRVAKIAGCPTNSTHCLEIKTSGESSPGWGGFFFGNMSRANAIFMAKIIAKIPMGKRIVFASNAYGSGGSASWITPANGTGKWETYICKIQCGDSGSFASTSFFYLDGGNTPTPTNPVIWHVGYATVIDITDSNNLEARMNTAEQKITDSSIISTVSSQFYKKGETDSRYAAQSQITQLANQISSKVDVNGVKSIIQQNPNDIMIGFNGINNRININPRSMDFTAANGNRDMLLFGGQVCIYNNMDNKFLATAGSVVNDNNTFKGTGFLLSKHCTNFVIGRDANWDDVLTNRSPKPTHAFNIDFANHRIHMLYGMNTGDIYMQENNLGGVNVAYIKDLYTFGIKDYSTGKSLFTSVNGRITVGANVSFDGNALMNPTLYTNKLFFTNGQLAFGQHSSGANIMMNGVHWDWQGFNIVNARLQASYSLMATSPGRSVGADTASVETMLLQEDFSKYDELNHAVIVDMNEGFKCVYENNKKLENENEQLKLENNNLKEELSMTKNALDSILMDAV